ncbi:hypothetical protein Btru_053843, partial [Bulinus truncatus]
MLGLYRSSVNLKVIVVMTTYKRYLISGHHTKCSDIGMLTDPLDVHCLLTIHAPGVNIMDYVYVCQTALCLPEAIIQLCQRYLRNEDKVQSMKLLHARFPGSLEELLSWDREFFYHLFNARTDEVVNWVTNEDLELLEALGQSSFTEEHFRICFKCHYPQASHTLWFSRLKKLIERYVIREIAETGQLAVHPLVVYYIKVGLPLDKMYHTDDDIGRKFMRHVMSKTQENRSKHGRKGQIYGCHIHEWPLIQHLLQVAMHFQSYKTLLKAAVIGRNLIISCYPNESRQFYTLMHNSAKLIGSPSEAAVMEICLSQATFSGKDVNGRLALEYIDSAIEALKYQRHPFFYKMALRKKGRILESLGDHHRSLEFFQKAKEVVASQSFIAPGEALCVTDLQIEEDDISAEIQETIPLIFTGNNTEAKKRLVELFENIQDRYEHHPEYADILNAIGLATQRGARNNDEALFWYKKSHMERKHLERICPQFMLRTINNMAMILCRKGDPGEAEKYLRQALSILRDNGWYQHYTGLTLTHLSEVKVKLKDFQGAFNVTLEADKIIEKTSPSHDFRLKINLSLFHHRLVLGHDPSNDIPPLEDYIETLTSLGSLVKNNMSDDGHHYLMSAYEHCLFLHLLNSQDKFNYYKRKLFAHVDKNKFLRDILYRKNLTKSPSSLLSEHREFLDYLANTEYKDHTLDTFLAYILKSCPLCRNIRDVSDIKVWNKEINHLKGERLKMQRDLLSDMSPLNSGSSSEERLKFNEEQSEEAVNTTATDNSHDLLNHQIITPSAINNKQSLNNKPVINCFSTQGTRDHLALSDNSSTTNRRWEDLHPFGDEPTTVNVLNTSDDNKKLVKINNLEENSNSELTELSESELSLL